MMAVDAVPKISLKVISQQNLFYFSSLPVLVVLLSSKFIKIEFFPLHATTTKQQKAMKLFKKDFTVCFAIFHKSGA